MKNKKKKKKKGRYTIHFPFNSVSEVPCRSWVKKGRYAFQLNVRCGMYQVGKRKGEESQFFSESPDSKAFISTFRLVVVVVVVVIIVVEIVVVVIVVCQFICCCVHCNAVLYSLRTTN